MYKVNITNILKVYRNVTWDQMISELSINGKYIDYIWGIQIRELMMFIIHVQ